MAVDLLFFKNKKKRWDAFKLKKREKIIRARRRERPRSRAREKRKGHFKTKKMLLTSSQFSPAGHSFGDAYLAACFKFSSSRPELSGAHSAGNRCPSFASRAHLVSLKSAVSQISRKRHTKVQTLVILFPVVCLVFVGRPSNDLIIRRP